MPEELRVYLLWVGPHSWIWEDLSVLMSLFFWGWVFWFGFGLWRVSHVTQAGLELTV